MGFNGHRVGMQTVPGLLAVATLFTALAAGASEFRAEGTLEAQAAPGVRTVAWEEFRGRCEHPEQYDVQRAPQNIRIQCMDRRLNWVASAPGEIDLPTGRRVSAGIISDKFAVERSDHEVAQAAKSGSCQRFKEVEEIFTVERPVSCQEILAASGDAGEFCREILDGAKRGNPKWVERKDTNRVLDTCASAAIEVRSDGQGG